MAFSDYLPAFTIGHSRPASANYLSLPSVPNNYLFKALSQCATCDRYGIPGGHYGCAGVYPTTPELANPYLLENSNIITRFILNYRIYLSLAHLTHNPLGDGVFDPGLVIGGAAAVGGDSGFEATPYSVQTYSCNPKPAGEGSYTYPTGYPNDETLGIARLGNVVLAGRPLIVRLIEWPGALDGSPFYVHFYTPLGTLDATKINSELPITLSIAWWNSGARPTWSGLAVQELGGSGAGDPREALAELQRGGPRIILAQNSRGVAMDIGNPETYTGTAGGLGSDTLVDDGFDAAGSPTTVTTNMLVGRWGKSDSYTDANGKTRMVLVPGLEVLKTAADGTAGTFTAPSSWPGLGPAAGLQAAPADGLGEPLTTTNDPHGRLGAMAVQGGSGWRNLHNPAVKGNTMGRVPYFPPSDSRATVFFPRPVAAAGLQTSEFCTLDYTTRTVGGVEYAGLMQIRRGFDYFPTGAFPSGALVTNITPRAFVSGSGTVTMLLENLTDTVGYWDSGQEEEKFVTFKHGGCQVLPPQRFRITNYASSQAIGGDGHANFIEAGDVVIFDDPSMPAELRGLRLVVSAAKAYDDNYGNPDYFDPDHQEEDNDDAWYAGHLASRDGMPSDFLSYGRIHATLTLINENGLVGTLLEASALVGLSFRVERYACVCKPSFLELAHGTPTGSDTAVSTGYLFFAASGRIYLPENYGTDCLLAKVDLLDGNRLLSLGNVLNPMIGALQGVLGASTFTINLNGPTNSLIRSLGIQHSDTGAPFDPQITEPTWDGTYWVWTEGAVRYSYYESTGGEDNYAEVYIDGEDPWRGASLALCNTMQPFNSPEIEISKWGAAEVAGGNLDLNAVNLTMIQTVYTRAWNAEHTTVVQSFTTEELTELSVTICLLGINYDSEGVPAYTVLSTSGASLSTLESGTTISVDVEDWLKALYGARGEYLHFTVWIGASGFMVTPDVPMDGPQFMRALAEKMYQHDMTYEDGEWTGTVTGLSISFDSLALTGGLTFWNAAAMDLDPGEA